MSIFKKFSNKKNNENEAESRQASDMQDTSEEETNQAEEMEEIPEQSTSSEELPEDAKKVIEAAQKIAQNPDSQIRFVIEHKLMPSKLIADPVYVITSLISDHGAYINNFFTMLYKQNNLETPYTLEDFSVSVPMDIAGVKVLKIDMPKKNIMPSLCRTIYIAYNEHFTKHLYATVEAAENDEYTLAAWIDGEHEEYGVVSDDELKVLESIIADEEIAEPPYSGVIQKLMENAQPLPNGLPTEPEEIKKHVNTYMGAVMHAQKLKREGKKEDAFRLIREIIRKEAIEYNNDENTEYHCFRNVFDIMLYANLYHPYNPENGQKKLLSAMQVDISAAYLVYGAMMLEQKQYDKAIDIFWKAVEANPVNLQLMFALADAYKGKGYYKSYFEILKKAHVCAVNKTDIARIYRNLSLYYTHIKQFEIAAACVYASKYFEENTQGFEYCLNLVQEASGRTFAEPKKEDVKTILSSQGISWGVKELVPGVIQLMQAQFTQANNEQGLKMCEALIKEITIED